MKIREIITIDPEILSGTPVFAGSRVPVWSLFIHLEKGGSLEEFLEDFPKVKHEYAVALSKYKAVYPVTLPQQPLF